MCLSQQKYPVMVMVMEGRKGKKLVWQPRIMYLERWSQYSPRGMEGWEKRWNEEVICMMGGREVFGHTRIDRDHFESSLLLK